LTGFGKFGVGPVPSLSVEALPEDARTSIERDREA
jgi:hypothetical protein